MVFHRDAAFRMLVSYHPIKRKLRAIIERLETAHRKLCECMTYPKYTLEITS